MDTDLHAQQARETIQVLRWLSGACSVIAVVAMVGCMQSDDQRAADEAQAYATGFRAGVAKAHASVADAYSVGVLAGARTECSGVAR